MNTKMEIGIITFDELKSVKTTIVNRANNTNNSSYTDKQNERYERRVKRLVKVISRDGYDMHIPLYIGNLNGEKYILDGQGRREAIIRINEKSLQTKGKLEIPNVPVITYTIDNVNEMFGIIKSLNTNHTDWNTIDILRAKAYLTDNPYSINVWDKLVEIMDTFQVGEYIATYIMFGYNGSRKNTIYDSIKHEQYETYLETYRILHEKVMKYGDKNALVLIKNTNFYVVFSSFIGQLITHYRQCYTDNLSVRAGVCKQVEIFAERFAKEDRYTNERNIIKTDKKNGKCYFWQYISLISQNSTRKWEVIKDAAYAMFTKSVNDNKRIYKQIV